MNLSEIDHVIKHLAEVTGCLPGLLGGYDAAISTN